MTLAPKLSPAVPEADLPKIGLLGVPYDSNSSFLRGPSYAPLRIRLMDKDGSANQYAELGTLISQEKAYQDLGDIEFETVEGPKAFDKILQRVQLEVKKMKLLCLGGDHSVTYPIVKAHATKYSELNILHIDAHPDLYNNFDNNPFSHASPFARIMENNFAKSLTQVGIRTLNAHQREQAKKFNVRQIEMHNYSTNFLKDLKGPLYLSLDLDSLDPAFAPGVSHHEPGGLSVRDVLGIIQSIPVEIVGADIVEYNPSRDHQNMTAMVAYKFMKEIMAKMM